MIKQQVKIIWYLSPPLVQEVGRKFASYNVNMVLAPHLSLYIMETIEKFSGSNFKPRSSVLIGIHALLHTASSMLSELD